MTFTKFNFFFVLLALLNIVRSEEGTKPPIEYVDSVHPIANLTQENFDLYVTSQDYGPWFVMFFAPWCGHCKRAAPAWIELSKAVEGKANIGMVDGDSNSYLTRRFFIRGYPTFIFFNEGKMYNYDGPRSVDGWQRFVEEGYKHAIGEELPEGVSTFGQFYKEVETAANQVISLGTEQPLLLVAIVVGFLAFMVLTFWCMYQVTEKLTAGQAPQGTNVNKEETAATVDSDPKKLKTE